MKLYEINSKEFNFSCIYLWTNKVNNKKYVGQTQNMGMRFKKYKQGDFNPYMKKAINKYGLNNFEITILEQNIDLNLLDEKEQYWMDYYKSYNKDYGYNLCRQASSTREVVRSEETRNKMSKAAIERFSLSGGTWKGRKHSEETKKEMSKIASQLHSNYPEKWENRRKFSEKEKEDTSNFFKEYWNTHEHSFKGKKHTDITKQKMSELAKGQPRNRRKRKVSCYSMEDKYICTYDSISQAAQTIGHPNGVSSISSCIKGRKKSMYGYKWKDEGLYHES